MSQVEATDMGVVIPEAIRVTIRNDVVELKMVKVGQIARITRVVAPIYDMIYAYKDAMVKIAKGQPAPDVKQPDLMDVALNHPEVVIGLVAILTDRDPEWVEDLNIEELVVLLTAVVEVNLDFFIQRVLPSLLKLAESFGVAMDAQKLSGQIPSNS